jgi:MtrB/PioB family decaheme-associated outer membrane protein
MRNRMLIAAAALFLVAHEGRAQTLSPQGPGQPPAGSTVPFTGTADFGALFTGTDGDAARYERYRDTRDGLYSSVTASRHTDAFLFDANAYHIGYRDQRYDVLYTRHRLDVGFSFRGQPLNYSDIARTPYTVDGSVLTLDDNAQRAVQGPTVAASDGTAVGVPCAPGAPPAACNNPAQAAQAIAARSIYNNLAPAFDLRQTRNTARLDATYAATRDIDLDGSFTSTGRRGQQPWSGSFAFNNAVELPVPIDQRTNDLTAGASWRRQRAMLRLAYDGSWFSNQFRSLTWDNPIFINDYNNGLAPPNGPYDPSGYSNGNGPAQGREALAPDNDMHVLSAVGLYKLPRRSTLNGTVQFTTQNQNDTLIPWTVNSVINSPQVIAAFPHLAQNPRATAEAQAKGVNTLINFSSRLEDRINLTVRYRYNRRDVTTPVFDATEYVRFDAVPEENPEGFTPQFDNSRHLFDANIAYTPAHLGTVRIGYGHEAIHREGRGFADVGENIFRTSWDMYSSQLFSVRAAFDAGRRRGSGFVEAASGSDDTDTGATGPGGTQPTLRYYDEADRNRVRGSVVFTVMPRDNVDLFVQFAGGRDTYLADDSVPVSRPGELFGLQNSSTTSWNVGLNYNPTDRIGAGGSYGRDTMGSFQTSRNANPPPDPTWTDPSRDWTLDNDDTIDNVNLYLDLRQLLWRSDLRVGYDFSDSTNAFVHGGPRIASLSAAGQFIPLPNVTNSWHRFTADVQHYFTPRIGIGVGYYFEKLSIVDYDTIDTNGSVAFTPATGDPRIDWLGGLITGYGNRPYTGSTGFIRLLYRF